MDALYVLCKTQISFKIILQHLFKREYIFFLIYCCISVYTALNYALNFCIQLCFVYIQHLLTSRADIAIKWYSQRFNINAVFGLDIFRRQYIMEYIYCVAIQLASAQTRSASIMERFKILAVTLLSSIYDVQARWNSPIGYCLVVVCDFFYKFKSRFRPDATT